MAKLENLDKDNRWRIWKVYWKNMVAKFKKRENIMENNVAKLENFDGNGKILKIEWNNMVAKLENLKNLMKKQGGKIGKFR